MPALAKSRSYPQSPSPRRALQEALGIGLMWITPLGEIGAKNMIYLSWAANKIVYAAQIVNL